jgi:RNA polymerase sigma-70 factor (ECF subfamily)
MDQTLHATMNDHGDSPEDAGPGPLAGPPPATPGKAAGQEQDSLFRKMIADHGTALRYFVLKRVGNPDEAAEIVQHAFAEAACGFSSYRGQAQLSTWLYGIALNLARNHVNRCPTRRHVFESEEGLDSYESAEAEPSVQLGRRQSLSLATRAMESLSPDMRKALHLVAVEELSYDEAAEQLEVPVGTVRSRVSRARALVREFFDRANAVPEI